MFKKSFPYVITFIIGAAMIGTSLLIREEALKAVSGVLIGVGAGLMGMSISSLSNIHYLKRHPSAAKQAEIDMKDERNVLIRSRAKAAAADITRWFIIALAFIMILIDAPLWVTLCVIAVYTLYHILALCFMARYQKQM